MPEIAELIERLEKAKGPDREVDLAIECFVRPNGNIAKLTRDHPRGLNREVGMAWDFWHSGSIVFEKRNADGTCPYNGGYRLLPFTASIDAARSLLPWKDHPGATFTSKTIQSGYGEFYHYVEFTWPSTERQGRGRTEAIATCICALAAIEETERQLAPYRARASLAQERREEG